MHIFEEQVSNRMSKTCRHCGQQPEDTRLHAVYPHHGYGSPDYDVFCDEGCFISHVMQTLHYEEREGGTLNGETTHAYFDGERLVTITVDECPDIELLQNWEFDVEEEEEKAVAA